MRNLGQGYTGLQKFTTLFYEHAKTDDRQDKNFDRSVKVISNDKSKGSIGKSSCIIKIISIIDSYYSTTFILVFVLFKIEHVLSVGVILANIPVPNFECFRYVFFSCFSGKC